MFTLPIIFWYAMIAIAVIAAFAAWLSLGAAGNRNANDIAARADAMNRIYRENRERNIARYGRDSHGNTR